MKASTKLFILVNVAAAVMAIATFVIPGAVQPDALIVTTMPFLFLNVPALILRAGGY
jgi:hypothetical protein